MTESWTGPREPADGFAASDLVVTANFIQTAREMGYVSIASALSELVDNSLQAGASEVTIHIRHSTSGDKPTITVRDNGSGMTEEELSSCLKFGGSSRFDDRSSLGRFGVGLPAASLSQSRRVSVHSWSSTQEVRFVRLDLDRVVSGEPVCLRPQGDSHFESSGSGSGTQVTWECCDRIEYRRLAWLERSLRRDLGRIFRDFIDKGLRLLIGDEAALSIDPLMRNVELNGVMPIRPVEPLYFALPYGDGSQTSTVTVTFSELPVEHWAEIDAATKRTVGIVGGSGVSVMRAGREIATGWLFMGGKRKENYDDWWRCEIHFEPELDEQFGITSIKQGIRPTAHLDSVLSTDLEPLARLLNGRARSAFEAAKFAKAAADSCRVAAAAEQSLPTLTSDHLSSQPLSYALRSESIPGTDMFVSSLEHSVLTITLNRDHAAFNALYGPLQTLDSDDGRQLRMAVELLILAYARAGVPDQSAPNDSEDDLLSKWSTAYSRMVRQS